jgi:serine/threonine-protein kinase
MPAPRQHKQTLLGLPAASLAAVSSRPPASKFSSQPAVPPLVPRPQSIPPGHSAPPRAGAILGGAAAEPPRLDMDWDDEELSTQIYDRPEDRTPANSHGSGPQQPIGHGSGPYQQVSGSFPPSGVQPGSGGYRPHPMGEPPGAPSPFAPAAATPNPYANHPGASTVEIAAWPQPGLGSERRPMLAAVLAVVAIIGAIVAALLIFRAPSTGAVQLRTTPGDATVALDGKPIVGSSPFVINDVVPSVQHEIVVRKAGYRETTTRFELQADQADKDKPMELPAITLEALESGFALDSVPSSAAVFVDGQRQAQTTPVRVTALGPGDHLIRLEAEGYAPWESSLHVTPGTVLDLPTAQLIARAPEPDQRSAPRPAPIAAPVAAPAPRPRARATGSSAASRPVHEEIAAAPEPAPVQHEEPAPEPAAEPAASGGTGTLRVQTRPWSKVFADGRPLGNTPLMNVSLSAGKHTLLFVNDDFGIRKTVKVQIEAGQVLTQVLTLTD